jgi:dATP pyrophosphohydrolase
MRAPFQIIVFPYRIINRNIEVLIGERSDAAYWQAVSGGGENSESLLEAAKRELAEETGLYGKDWLQLDSMCTLPKVYYSGHENWDEDLHVIPEYAFATRAYGELIISSEHTRLEWHRISTAQSMLKYDSNRNALWELCRRVSL